MNLKDAVDKIEDLIESFNDLDDDEYLEVLEEMEERARLTREAFLEDNE